MDPNATYDVEEILDYKIQNGQVKYLIKWFGLPMLRKHLGAKQNLSYPEKLDESVSAGSVFRCNDNGLTVLQTCSGNLYIAGSVAAPDCEWHI